MQYTLLSGFTTIMAMRDSMPVEFDVWWLLATFFIIFYLLHFRCTGRNRQTKKAKAIWLLNHHHHYLKRKSFRFESLSDYYRL